MNVDLKIDSVFLRILVETRRLQRVAPIPETTVGFHSPKIWLLPKVSLLVVDFLQEIVKSDTFLPNY